MSMKNEKKQKLVPSPLNTLLLLILLHLSRRLPSTSHLHPCNPLLRPYQLLAKLLDCQLHRISNKQPLLSNRPHSLHMLLKA